MSPKARKEKGHGKPTEGHQQHSKHLWQLQHDGVRDMCAGTT
jgi:hypothetical protein